MCSWKPAVALYINFWFMAKYSASQHQYICILYVAMYSVNDIDACSCYKPCIYNSMHLHLYCEPCGTV